MSLRAKIVLVAVGSATALVLVLSALLLALGGSSSHRPIATAGQSTVPNESSSTVQPGRTGAEADIEAMRTAPVVSAKVSTRLPAIGGAALRQPDLFAEAFVSRLLSTDFQTINRSALLSWVQAESAATNEHDVVGLIPSSLRAKLPVYSVSTSTDGSPVPIPTQAEWAAWHARGASATVQIQKVFEPPQWSSAVASGEIRDPGITEREVDAEVVTRWTDHGRAETSRRSVALTLNLEGPPTRRDYGFVTLVLYQEVAG